MSMRVERFAHFLTRDVYLQTLEGRFAKDFVLSKQIRGVALSVPSNIAEGFERGNRNEFTQFLSIAKASCGEVRSDLYIAMDGLRSAVARQRKRTQSSVLSPQSS